MTGHYLDIPGADEGIGAFVREFRRLVRLLDQSVAIVGQGNEDVAFAQICSNTENGFFFYMLVIL